LLATSSGMICGSRRMSAIWSRPPGFKTRKTSPSTLGLSGQRLKTPLEITRSIEVSGKGNAGLSPEDTPHLSQRTGTVTIAVIRLARRIQVPDCTPGVFHDRVTGHLHGRSDDGVQATVRRSAE